ncbi:uncharacterized protein LOC105798903 isoform X2 [Gossypium raimondii]|uniref:uncharacterized protein LOC105798903 isoform X2 n=1 Tax=Gossypium raimondii TaxID=29730 RepID=UPI00227A307A|nr:uncharacterized protein LOC105798903 isoform X2 [Gossypium raimondii]
MLKFRIKILHHLSVAAKEDLNPITEYPSNQKSPLVNPSKFDVKNNTKFPDNPSVTGKDDESDTQQPPRHPQFGQQRTNKRSGGSRLYLRGKRLKMISPQSKPWQAASDYEGPRTETHLVTEPIEGTLIICFQGYGIENSHQIILFQCISYPSKFLEHIRNWRD